MRGVLDEFDDRVEAFVGMMQEHVLFAHHFEDIGVWRQSRIARGLKDAILQLREGVICDQRRQVRHRERTVQPVQIHFSEIKKLEKQFAEIFRTIRCHFQAHRVAAARTPQFLLDAAQKIIGFFLVDIEIAVPGDPKSVRAIEEQAGEKIGDVTFDE